MAEYLKDIAIVDNWTLQLSMAELNTNSQGISEQIWFKSEEYSIFVILSLGRGKLEDGLDTAYHTIKSRALLMNEKPEPQMEITIFPIHDSQIIH